MLTLNKYLREIGYSEETFPFKKENKNYYPDKNGFVPAEFYDLDVTIAMETYSRLCYFREYIADRVNEAVDIIKASGKSSTKDLSAATKTQLKGLVEKVSANTSVKATVQGNNVVVYKPDGGVFASIDKPIKQTGSESSIVALIASVSFLITVAGACLVVKQVKTSK